MACSFKLIKLFLIAIICLTYKPTFAQLSAPANDYIDSFSRSSVLVIATSHRKAVWNASGFFLRIKHDVYFITNNHVVGGKFKIDEYQRLFHHALPADSLPDMLLVRVYDNAFSQSHMLPIQLFEANNRQWIEFYFDRNDPSTLMDVVALKVKNVDTSFFHSTYILSVQNLMTDGKLFPSQELFIVGFPLDIGLSVTYPIWKRGTIASDPTVLVERQPGFYIDATTRGGMSGSPVFFRSNSYFTSYGGVVTGNHIFNFLIGIYRAQSVAAELGAVVHLGPVIARLSEISQ